MDVVVNVWKKDGLAGLSALKIRAAIKGSLARTGELDVNDYFAKIGDLAAFAFIQKVQKAADNLPIPPTTGGLL